MVNRLKREGEEEVMDMAANEVVRIKEELKRGEGGWGGKSR